MRPTTSRVGRWHLTATCMLLLLAGSKAVPLIADGNPSIKRVVRVPMNDALTPGNLTRLEGKSATARDVLARLELVPDAIFIVVAHPRLVHDERLFGRGRFWVVQGRLFGILEYQAEPAGSRRALRTLAHELAHALEVGMLPRSGGTRVLRSLLELRDRDGDVDRAPGIETDFARAVAYRVHLELLGRLPNSTELLAQAERSHVVIPPRPHDVTDAKRR
jgi:hypothetical protein